MKREESGYKLNIEREVNYISVINVKVVNKSNNPLPKYSTLGSAGMDLMAWIEDGSTIVLKPGERKLIPTGLHFQLPKGFELQVRARSGLALKYGISLVNGIGTIDSDYTGDVGVILINLGDKDFEIHNGDRIAQAVITNYYNTVLTEVDELEKTERGDGGFGHTGVN